MDEQSFLYLLGLLFTDGWRDKSGYHIELKEEDDNILKSYHEKIKSQISQRMRDTNFAKNFVCTRLDIKDKKLIEKIDSYWVENKTDNIFIPTVYRLSPSIWRGVLDGDGCYGFRGGQTPYVGFTTKSEKLKDDFLYVVKEIVGQEIVATRNKRDNIYNLGLTSINAKKFVVWLLSENNNYIERKYNTMIKIAQWLPTGRQGESKRRWTKEEDDYVYTHSLKECLVYLDRTKNAITCRRTKLNKERKK